MMSLFFIYELKVAVLTTMFYFFWRLLVANETWHRLNRIVLMLTAIASFVLPLCVITIHQSIEVIPIPMEQMQAMILEEKTMSPEATSMNLEKVQPFSWQLLLTLIYIIGVLVFLLKMLLSLWQLHKMIVESEIHPLADGRRIAVCDKIKSPFSTLQVHKKIVL